MVQKYKFGPICKSVLYKVTSREDRRKDRASEEGDLLLYILEFLFYFLHSFHHAFQLYGFQIGYDGILFTFYQHERSWAKK